MPRLLAAGSAAATFDFGSPGIIFLLIIGWMKSMIMVRHRVPSIPLTLGKMEQ